MAGVSRRGSSSRRSAHLVRIIGGQWRRSKLPVPDKPGLRPTPERVRETLFNWLGQDLSGWHCVDAFAGTGALGLEAASRGAAEVLLVEQDAGLVRLLRASKERLHAGAVRIEQGDGVRALRSYAPQGVDLILLDPPFETPELILPALEAAAKAVRPERFIYLELPTLQPEPVLAECGLRLHRHLKAGTVHAHLLVREAAASA